MRYRARITWHIAGFLIMTAVVCGAVAHGLGAAPKAAALPFLILLFMFMAGMGARGIARKLAGPIEALADASRRFGSGDLGTRVVLPVHRHGPARAFDDIAALGREWNDMAERIERLVRAQRELLANVSHELRSPLARIRVALELLPRTAETEPRLDAVAEDIAELDRLIDDVLTAARLDAAPMLRPAPVDVDELLEAVRARAGHDPLSAGLELRVVKGGGTISADAALLRRALCNLVENAAKHGAPPVVLAAERRKDELLLSVTDDGPGIPASQRTSVLEPFTRLDGARTPSARAGVGLGLTIARRVAETHGGSLELGAAGPRGLRVTLRLPFTRASSGTHEAETRPPHVIGSR